MIGIAPTHIIADESAPTPNDLATSQAETQKYFQGLAQEINQNIRQQSLLQHLLAENASQKEDLAVETARVEQARADWRAELDHRVGLKDQVEKLKTQVVSAAQQKAAQETATATARNLMIKAGQAATAAINKTTVEGFHDALRQDRALAAKRDEARWTAFEQAVLHRVDKNIATLTKALPDPQALTSLDKDLKAFRQEFDTILPVLRTVATKRSNSDADIIATIHTSAETTQSEGRANVANLSKELFQTSQTTQREVITKTDAMLQPLRNAAANASHKGAVDTASLNKITTQVRDLQDLCIMQNAQSQSPLGQPRPRSGSRHRDSRSPSRSEHSRSRSPRRSRQSRSHSSGTSRSRSVSSGSSMDDDHNPQETHPNEINVDCDERRLQPVTQPQANARSGKPGPPNAFQQCIDNADTPADPTFARPAPVRPRTSIPAPLRSPLLADPYPTPRVPAVAQPSSKSTPSKDTLSAVWVKLSNIPVECSDETLVDLLDKVQHVVPFPKALVLLRKQTPSPRAATRKRTPNKRSFAFVKCASQDHSESLIKALVGTRINQTPLIANHAMYRVDLPLDEEGNPGDVPLPSHHPASVALRGRIKRQDQARAAAQAQAARQDAPVIVTRDPLPLAARSTQRAIRPPLAQALPAPISITTAALPAHKPPTPSHKAAPRDRSSSKRPHSHRRSQDPNSSGSKSKRQREHK